MRLGFLVALLATRAAAAPPGLAPELLRAHVPREAAVAPLRDATPTWANRQGPGVYWRWASPGDVHAPYYALHFHDFRDSSGAQWTIRIQSSGGPDLLTIRPDDHRAGDFWTDDLHAAHLTVVVEADRRPTGLAFTLDQWIIADPTVPVRSVLDPNHSMIEPIGNYQSETKIWSSSRAIAKLSIYDGHERYPCTGFLIGENLLLTNAHCMPDGIPVRKPGLCADAIKALFDFRASVPAPAVYVCTQVLVIDQALDYAVVQLAGQPGRSWGVLPLASNRAPATGATPEPLFVVQHPGGREKSIAYNRCHAGKVGVDGVPSELTAQDFEHTCDTEGGSSGSPVFDAQGRVVGLHHYGFDDTAIVKMNQAVLMRLIVPSFPSDVQQALVH